MFYKYYICFCILLFSIKCIANSEADCGLNIESVKFFAFANVKAQSPTIDAETLFENTYDRVRSCDENSKIVIKAKYQLANFWSEYGIELTKAEKLLNDVLVYHQRKTSQSIWTIKPYIKVKYSLARVFYKQGRFIDSLNLIKSSQENFANYPKIESSIKNDIYSLELLVAIALKNSLLITNKYKYNEDIKLLKEEGVKVHSSILGFQYIGNRKPIVRIIRWLQYSYVFQQAASNSVNLDVLDKLLLTKKSGDEILLEYAMSRLLTYSSDKCDNKFSKYILFQHKNNSIEKEVNKITAKALNVECSGEKNKQTELSQYAKMLENFYQTMPINFSPESFLAIHFSLESILSNTDWTMSQHLHKGLILLFQLNQAASPVISSARFDKSMIRSSSARKLYVEREQYRNEYFKLSQLLLSERDEIRFEKVKLKLFSADEKLKSEHPEITKYDINKIYELSSLQSMISDDMQISWVEVTSTQVINLIISKDVTEVKFTKVSSAKVLDKVKEYRKKILLNNGYKELAKNLGTIIPGFSQLDLAKEKLLVITDPKLSNLPLSLIYNNNSDKWLVEDFQMERHLNLASIINSNNRGVSDFKSRLAIANPIFDYLQRKGRPSNENSEHISLRSGDNKAFGLTKYAALASLPRLLETETEAFSFIDNTAINSDILFAVNATEKNIIHKLNKTWDVILFSTHTLFPSDYPDLDYPAIALTPESDQPTNDGILESREISRLSFHNSFIILAACDTANSVGERNNLGSLLHSFLFTGARSVLASHWKVNSQETLKFMITLSNKLNHKTTESRAVWEARKELLKNNYAPKVWSAFDLYY
jgi:CHAT domain-containing protein